MSQLVFIRGTGRCGSKTLIQELARHPDIARLPFNEILPEELIDWTAFRLGSQRSMTEEIQGAACRAYLAALCRELCPDVRIVVQKTTMNVHRMGELLRCWPDSKVIYLVRHPLAVVESLINSNIREGQSFKATVANSSLRWFNEVSAYLHSSAFGHPRVLQVHFEQLIEQPQETVNRICRFLEIGSLGVSRLTGRERYQRRFCLAPREREWILESTRPLAGAVGYALYPADTASDYPLVKETDFADRRLHAVPPVLDGIELIGLAVQRAAEEGFRRIGFFGAGYFARLVCPRLDLKALVLEPVGLFDENPTNCRSRIGRLNVFYPREVRDLGVEAVIPLTFVHQAGMIRRWEDLYGHLAHIISLWEESQPVGRHPIVRNPRKEICTNDRRIH